MWSSARSAASDAGRDQRLIVWSDVQAYAHAIREPQEVLTFIEGHTATNDP
jgi:hypothetical protein